MYIGFAPSMKRDTLQHRLTAISAKIKVPELVALGKDTNLPVIEIHDTCYSQDGAVAFRAAWILEYIATHDPERFMSIFEEFIHRLPTQRNPSCQRHFTKILMLVTSSKAPAPYRTAYSGIDRGQVVETVFGWLIDPQTPVAVQVNCMDILFNMHSEFEWIREELRPQVEFLMRDGSAAMQSRGKKILAKLNKVKTAD